MPTCFLTCESCGTRLPTFLDQAVAEELQTGKIYPKHCLVCHSTTEWVIAFIDRRGGYDRRKGGPDRRQNRPEMRYQS